MSRACQRMSRFARCALAATLALGLVPSLAFAAPAADASETQNPSEASTAPSKDDGQSVAVEGQALVLYHASTDEAGLLAADGGAATDSEELVNAGFAVEQEWDFSAVDRALSADADATALLSEEGVGSSSSDLRIALVSRAEASTDELVAELETLDFVEAAQPNHIFSTSAAAPNDTYYETWQYNMTSESAGIDLQAALDARNESSTEGNIVAVIDTGVDYTNPDLADHMWRNPGIDGLPGNAGDYGYDFFDNDSDPMPGASFITSHGTHCSGVIAGITGNAQGIAGVSSDTEIMALKVSGADTGASLYENCVVSAFQYVIGAALAGENVVAISNSYDIGGYLPVIDYLVNQAGKAGILSVFAAGNENTDTAEATSYGATVGLESPYSIIVASSNEQNTLSTFSNWNETAVDLAAPGSEILSTLSTDAARESFCPQLSHQAGKELAYYNDFSDFAENPDKYQVRLQRLDGAPVTEQESSALAVEPINDAAFGSPGLKVTLDTTKLSQPSLSYAAVISWRTDNFFADSDHIASDYAFGVTCRLDQETSQSNGIMLTQMMLNNADTKQTLSTNTLVYSLYDNYSIGGTAINEIDTACSEIGIGALVVFSTAAGGGSTGTISGTVTGVGVGIIDGEGVTEETSAYVPYGLMGGTSMATPTIAGSLAQLAALNPDASPLELRGMVIGSTVPVQPLQGVDKPTATNGRFDWNIAVDAESTSANTWAAETDAVTGATTVYGYGLADATLYLDGEAVAPITQNDGAISFTAPASSLDGGRHRFDVVDASTGKKHCAAYTMPMGNEGYELDYVGSLPDELAARGAYELAATDDALYAAALDGSYLFATSNPSTAAWERVAAPGNPWEGTNNGDVRNGLAYGSLGDTLYAFAVSSTDDPDDGSPIAHVTVASYDPVRDRWSDFEEIDAFPASTNEAETISTLMPSVASCDGSIYCLLTYYPKTEDGKATMRLYGGSNANGFEMVNLSEAEQVNDIEFFQIACADNGLVAVGSKATAPATEEGSAPETASDEEAYEVHGLSYDAETRAWTDLGTFDGAPAFGKTENANLFRTNMEGFETGIVVEGLAFEEIGDISFLDFKTMEWKGLGTFGVSSSTGLVVSSTTLFDDRMYFGATGSETGIAGALYALPYATVEAMLGIACPSINYPDFNPAAWYHGAVDWAVSNGVMTGFDENAGDLAGHFGPDLELTRAQMAKLLHNQAGNPETTATENYVDVQEGDWFYEAVVWATEQGLFTGYDDGSNRFDPNAPILREDAAVVLWRLSHKPTGAGDLSEFPDGDAVDAWAVEAMSWAVGEGIFTGRDFTGVLDPQGDITRAEAATLMMRLAKMGA